MTVLYNENISRAQQPITKTLGSNIFEKIKTIEQSIVDEIFLHHDNPRLTLFQIV